MTQLAQAYILRALRTVLNKTCGIGKPRWADPPWRIRDQGHLAEIATQLTKELVPAAAPPQYRVWNIINISGDVLRFPVDSPEQGARLIDRLSEIQLRQTWIESNAFGLEVLKDTGWEEWYDEADRAVDEVFA